jgi:5'-3' exoribonuclease 2
MLLRGVKFPPPALDRADIEVVQSRARRGHRQDRDRHHGGGGRFENGNYGDAMAPRPEPKRWRNDPPANGGGPNLNPSNPFAAFINPSFNPGVVSRAPPPPHMAAAKGWVPPPPESYGSNGYPPRPSRGGYGDRRGGYNGGGYDRY